MPTQVTHPPTRSERSYIKETVFDKAWLDGYYLCTIIKEGHTALSINPYPGYIFDPVPLVEGTGIQEGSLCMTPYALAVLPWSTFGMVTFP